MRYLNEEEMCIMLQEVSIHDFTYTLSSYNDWDGTCLRLKTYYRITEKEIDLGSY